MTSTLTIDHETKELRLNGKTVSGYSVGEEIKLSDISKLTDICRQLGKIEGYKFKIE